jgi:tripartite ATP-independent transporter DctM subunit
MELLGILILVISFLGLLTIGVPIAYSIGLSAIFTLLTGVFPIPSFTTVAQQMATGLDSFSLLAIPFFVLTGQLMNKGGIAIRLIEFAKCLVGRFPGGLAFVNIMANMLFGSISGSAAAAASAIGGTMGPVMKKEGYPTPFSTSINVTSAITGLIIPPSNVLIVYSLASGGLSIAALFIAGYVPGIIMGLSLMVVAAYLSKKYNYPMAEKMGLKATLLKFVDAMPSLLLLVIVIGGILAGIFTATEASAVAVIYAFILSMIYKEVKVKDIRGIVLSSVEIVSIVLLLVAASVSLSWVMSYVKIPQSICEFMLSFSNNKIIVLLLINLLLLFVGIFMDITPAVLIFTPIFLPVVQAFGIDPIHFGMILVMNLSIGLCTPPVGSVLFIGCSVSNIKIEKVIKPLIPLYVALIIGLLLVTFIPELSTWLPKAFGLMD